MTLLVVLGVVVVATILAALYLSLKSGRRRDGAPGADGTSTGARQARGGSRSEGSPSLGGRIRSMTGRNEADEYRGRRVAGRSGDDYDVPDYATARRGARGPGGPDRSGLVASATGQRAAGARPGPGFDDADPAFRGGYGREPAGYDGYDAAADTRVSGPLGTEPGTDPFRTGDYDAPTGPRRGYAGDPAGGPRGPEARRGRYPGSAPDYDTDPAATAAGGFGAAAPGAPGSPAGPGLAGASPAGSARAGHRRRAAGPGTAGAAGPLGPLDPNGPADQSGPAGYDEAATAVTRSPFAPARDPEPEPGDAAGPDDDSPTGRRRIGRIQKPRLRRAKPDYDNDPWPASDEEDGIPDDKYWEDLYSDKPLSTTARTAQAAGDADQSWPPSDPEQGSSPLPGTPDPVPAPVQGDGPLLGRGRRARRRQDDALDGGTEPRPVQRPDPGAGPGQRRRGGSLRPSRSAEEDPLTSESFSRHAREASDSRSYRGARDPNRLPSHGRRESPADETLSMRPDPRGFGAPGPAGPSGTPARPAGAPGGPGAPGPAPRGSRGTPPGGGMPPGARRDPYGDGTYRNGGRAATPYPEGPGGYPPAGRNGTRATPPPGAPSGNGRPPASANGRPPSSGNGQRHARPALPGGAPSPQVPTGRPPAYPPNGGSPYPGTPGGTRRSGGAADTPYPGSTGPGATGGTPYPGGSPGTGDYPQGRRSANRDSRRLPEDGYDDPYGRPDDSRY